MVEFRHDPVQIKNKGRIALRPLLGSLPRFLGTAMQALRRQQSQLTCQIKLSGTESAKVRQYVVKYKKRVQGEAKPSTKSVMFIIAAIYDGTL